MWCWSGNETAVAPWRLPIWPRDMEEGWKWCVKCSPNITSPLRSSTLERISTSSSLSESLSAISSLWKVVEAVLSSQLVSNTLLGSRAVPMSQKGCWNSQITKPRRRTSKMVQNGKQAVFVKRWVEGLISKARVSMWTKRSLKEGKIVQKGGQRSQGIPVQRLDCRRSENSPYSIYREAR